MSEHNAGINLVPILTARVTVKDKDGNIKFDGPVVFTPIEEPKDGSNSNDRS